MKLSKIQLDKLIYLLKTDLIKYENIEFSLDIKNNELLIVKMEQSLFNFYYWSYLNQNWEKR